MVNLTLSNHNKQSPDRQVKINFDTGFCQFEDRQISLAEFLKLPDFTHPLLDEPVKQSRKKIFHYEYKDVDGLLYTGIYVYSNLLKAAKPQECVFKIIPSARFPYINNKNPIDFSLYRSKAANAPITLKQLEAITSRMIGFRYEFLDHLIISDEFTIEGLPDTVDGDFLYKTDDDIVASLKKNYDFDRFELRYISPEIGLGVYSKQLVKKGEIISVYTGIKSQNRLPTLRFSFRPAQDCLKMYLDGSQYGNITRYINHAPAEDEPQAGFADLIDANVTAHGDYLNGIGVIVYIANRDIVKGEQLLVSYGEQYFKHAPMARFKTNGRIIGAKKEFILKSSQNKINHIKIMADNGVKDAQIHLLLRMVIIFMLLVGVFLM